jgi:RimJ/RimL family protein N-acetyltransferase
VTKLVRLRPVTEAELDLLELLFEDPDEASEYGFFGYQNPGRLHRRFAEKGFISADDGRLAVVVGDAGEAGEFIGEVSWHKAETGPDSFCWNIGIGLLSRARGQGHGTQAQRLLAEYLFAHTQVNRIEAETEVGNIAEQRSLEKAGFTREGTRRGSCFRAGRWRDMAAYSIVRADVHPG